MAYQQYDNPQPRQQQYHNQAAPPPGPQPAGYNSQYNDQYDYSQGQYEEQWDNGYYDDQPQGGYPNASGQMRQAQPGRRPPPRDQYGQDMYQDQMYSQPQGPGPRGRPMGPHGGAMRGGMPNSQRGQPGLRPHKSDRPQMAPVSPPGLSQDNAFPSFPSQNAKSRSNPDTMNDAMSHMHISQRDNPQGRPQGPPQGRGRGAPGPPQGRAPPPGMAGGYSNPDMQRQDSGHYEGSGRSGRGQQPPPRGYPQQRPPPMDLQGAQGPPPQRFNPASPTQQAFGPNTQRSMTMPQTMPPATNGRGHNHAQQWQEPGPVAGYHGPESPSYIPPRPSTATGAKGDGHLRQQPFQQRPPMPQIPPQQQQGQLPYQCDQDDGQGDLDNFYDDYYGDSGPAPQNTSGPSVDMPNFDAIPDSNNRQRRGYSIENHLSPNNSAPPVQRMPPATAGPTQTANAQQDGFYQQAARSRSQPDLHGQYSQSNGVFEMAGDAPAVPQLPRANTHQHAVGLPSGPRGRGMPPRGMAMESAPQRVPSNPGYGPGQPLPPRAPPNQGYGPGQPSPQRAPSNPGYGSGQPAPQRTPSNPGYGSGQQPNMDPRYRQQPHRGYSDQSAYSEPAPNTMRNGTPMAAGNLIARPDTAAPALGRVPSDPASRRAPPSNPDALPAHPTPVRPGLMQQKQDQRGPPQASRPPPMRQYHTDPIPARGNQPPPSAATQRPVSIAHPVTHDELNRLRNTLKTNPSDNATGLQLAKKLVEAASVLADEGGTADARTRSKNREKFINEAHKIVKKLVASGYPEAMFYLADCYGRGLLGLQVDTKEAFTLYQSAGKAGHAASAYRTAFCCEMGHEEGGGTKKDALKAVQWYRRAAALGDTPAMYKMGMILLKGLLGQQKNLGEAINMLKRAADRADEENPHALHELGLLYESQTGNERIIRDEAYAAQLFMQAAELGYKFSQFRLGQAYEYGVLGFPIDARSSIAWYTRAASQEEHQSELALSGWYLTGSQGILEQSDTEAYLWARKAACAEPPLPKALFAMGYFTEVGIGCPRSLEEAKRWYGRAATYKFPKAQERLEELKKGGAKAQKSRERLSRTNQKQHDENCVVM